MSKMRNRSSSGGHRQIIVIATALLLGVGAVIGLMVPQWSQEAPVPPTAVKLQLDWVHGGDFAGYYAADRIGAYAAAGLSVTLVPGGPKIDPVAPVVSGAANFGTSSAHNLIRARTAGEPVRAIACIYRRSPMVFAALESSDIVHPRDFAGRTIRVTKSATPVLNAVLAKAGVTDESYQLVSTRDTERFASGEIDVWAGYITGAVRRIRNAGHRLTIVYPDDFGVHNYHQCLFTTDKMIAQSPALVAKVLGSSLEGWRYTIDHAAEVAAMVLQWDEKIDLADMTEYVGVSRALFNTGEDHIGWMKQEVWAEMTSVLRDAGVLSVNLKPEEVFTLRFLEEIYSGEE